MPNPFENISYNDLNRLQVGQLGEYWVKLMLTLKGYDVYTSEVDDRGIDFVVRISPSLSGNCIAAWNTE